MQHVLSSGALAVVLVASVAAASAPRAQAHLSGAPARADQLMSGAQVDAYLTKARFRGYMLLVDRKGRTILSKGYGMADAEHKVPNTVESPYPAFGVIGFMIALATLKLQEQGKLHVQDKLCAYISGCPSAWRSITLHEVLVGTSGISSGGADLFAPPGGTIKQTVALCEAAPLQAAPGTLSEDNPCNRVVLSAVLTKVAHKPFGTLMQDLVFHPAGMTHTQVALRAAPPDSAQQYISGAPAPALSFGAYPLIYSTITDIERLDRAVLAGKILSAPAQRALLTPYINDNPPVAIGPYRAYGTFLVNPQNAAKVYAFTDQGAGGTSYFISNQFALHSSAMGIWFSNDSMWDGDADNTLVSLLGSLMEPLFPS
jgi:CubicO group peptidase (beta-lactamase class C family)